MKLTSSQEQAIQTTESNLQIIACAGSGKTQVVAERIIHILSKDGVQPRNIVAFTYTEKAAAELKQRVINMAKDRLGSQQGMAELYVGTIHAWCMYYLQEHAYGFQKYSILNEVRLKLFIDQRNRKIGMSDLVATVQGKPRSLRRYLDTGVYTTALGIARECESMKGEQLAPNINHAIEIYESELMRHGFFDFTMILTRFLKEIQKDSVMRSKIKEDIKYLIVDEYQDVNFIQETIISEINKLGAKLCVVGDDDQTIYQWRGSSIENILMFSKKYKDVVTVTLDDNFRSSNGVVELAHTAVNRIPESDRLSKKMNSAGHQIFEHCDLLLEEFSTVEAEEKFIVDTIKNIRGKAFQDKNNSVVRGIDYSDMAILLRKWKPATRIANALKAAGIPYVVTGVAQLFEQLEIVACINIFKFISGSVSGAELAGSWLAVATKLNGEKLEFAINQLAKIKPHNDKWHELFNLQEIFIKFRDEMGLAEDTIKSEAELGLSKSEVVFYNLGMFSQVIEDFEVIHFKDNQLDKLTNFLNFLNYSAKDYYPEGWLNKSMSSPNAIVVTTIHQAKGLEWPVVFIPKMNSNYFPAKGVGGLSVWHVLDKEKIKNYEGLKGSMNDELRLLYVAITRSKKFVFVTRAPGDSKQDKKPSVFIDYLSKTNYIFRAPGYDFSDRATAPMQDARNVSNIVLNFSLLEAFYKCPYSFKYYTLYGFKEPLSPRMGYGKSIHDSLMEIHRKAMSGNVPKKEELDEILSRHIHFPYAIPRVVQEMGEKARSALNEYYDLYEKEFHNIEYAEKNIELNLGDGIIVNGRMDLIRKKSLDEKEHTYIVDFKSQYKEDVHGVGLKQLMLYALGYKELTGETADFLQIYDFAKGKENNIKLVNDQLALAKNEIIMAADRIRSGDLEQRCGKAGCPCRFQQT